MQSIYNKLEAPPLNSRLEYLTQPLAKEFGVGILKHGFMVPLHEDYLDTAIHDLFPTQSLIGLGKLRDIESTEQPDFSGISRRSIVLYCGHTGPGIVENGVGQGKSKEPLQA